MKKKLLLTGLCAVFLMIGNLTAQQDSTLYKIINNPDFYHNKHVVVQGVVEQYIPIYLDYSEEELEKTVAYILRGDFGNKITIISHLQAPATNSKYRVSGLFQIVNDPKLTYEIIETRRVEIYAEAEAISFWEQYGLYILIFVGIILLILIVILFIVVLKKPAKISKTEPRIEKEIKKAEKEEPAFSTPSQYKTIRMAVNPPKTMRYMPGSLEIISGEDKGKSFKMAGYPTENGSIVTLGREVVTGEKAYSHIQLNDQTVSRKQAEIIYRDGKIFLKNLSEVNYTQVNDTDIKPNEIAEIQPGSVIRTGAVEFKYSL